MEKSKLAARSLWFERAGQAALRETALAAPGPGQALVRMLYSGVSRGTERLVFSGHVPESEAQRMRAPLQEGDFPFPVKYGYCAVGEVEAGPADWLGRKVFALHPHQDLFVVDTSWLQAVPANVPARRATLAAQMETALNALWDSGAGPGDRVAVIGGGVIGMLVAVLCQGLPGAEVTLADIVPARARLVEGLGVAFADARRPLPELAGCDIVFHASASPQGLELALDCAGREAKVVELSWYGDRRVLAPLGGRFHSGRLQLISSQVGEVSASRRPRWSHARRLAKALVLLADPRLDALITNEVPFSYAPDALPALLAHGAAGLWSVFAYQTNP